jgi:cytochrome d ubiquinol oxidase subunit II
MSDELLVNLAAATALGALMAYAVFGGADFGGGVWDLLASGPRKERQRDAIAHAMGPVWEANHVWLILVLVLLFTCFPNGYGPLAIALFIPFHLALLGIMLRGASFVFRNYSRKALDLVETAGSNTRGKPKRERFAAAWGTVFGVASVISPLLLGVAFGVLTQGQVRIDLQGNVGHDASMPWLSFYSVTCGLLALSTCAYLAAVYLTAETHHDLREDFRLRAILAGTTTAILAAVVFAATYYEAQWFFSQLTSLRCLPVLTVGLFFFAASAWAVYGRRYSLSRFFAAGEIAVLLLGWGLAQLPYLVYPDMTLMRAAAPRATIAFMLATIPFAAAVIGPSLWLLMRVFKTQAHDET